VLELLTGGYVEFREDLAEVVLDRAATDEQAKSDLRIGQPVAGQCCDLGLLGSQVALSCDLALSGRRPRRLELAPRSLGEGVHAHRFQ